MFSHGAAHFRSSCAAVVTCFVGPYWTEGYRSPKYMGADVLDILNTSLAEHDMPCISKQCRSRSVGFCTVCHDVCECNNRDQVI